MITCPFDIEVYRNPDSSFVCYCPSLDVYAYGRNVSQSIERMKMILAFYNDTAEETGFTFEEMGLKPISN